MANNIIASGLAADINSSVYESCADDDTDCQRDALGLLMPLSGDSKGAFAFASVSATTILETLLIPPPLSAAWSMAENAPHILLSQSAGGKGCGAKMPDDWDDDEGDSDEPGALLKYLDSVTPADTPEREVVLMAVLKIWTTIREGAQRRHGANPSPREVYDAMQEWLPTDEGKRALEKVKGQAREEVARLRPGRAKPGGKDPKLNYIGLSERERKELGILRYPSLGDHRGIAVTPPVTHTHEVPGQVDPAIDHRPGVESFEIPGRGSTNNIGGTPGLSEPSSSVPSLLTVGKIGAGLVTGIVLVATLPKWGPPAAATVGLAWLFGRGAGDSEPDFAGVSTKHV